MFKADNAYISIISIKYEDFLDLYLKSVFKKIVYIKSLVFSKKNEKRIEIKFRTLV